MTDADDSYDSTSIHNSPWLLFPWQTTTASVASVTSRRRHRPLTAFDNNNNDDDATASTSNLNYNDDNHDTNSLTQFPPYGSTTQQQQRAHPDVPPDWLNHLSQLSALATLSEQQQQQAQASVDVVPAAVRSTTTVDSLDYDWEATERDLWSMTEQQQQASGNTAILVRQQNTTIQPPKKTRQQEEYDELLLGVPKEDKTTWRDRRLERQHLLFKESANRAPVVCQVCRRHAIPLTTTFVSQQVCIACRWRLKSSPQTDETNDADGEEDANSQHFQERGQASTGPSTVVPNAAELTETTTSMLQVPTSTSNDENEPSPEKVQAATTAAEEGAPSLEAATSASPTLVHASRQEANVHLGTTAADHLQVVARHLLQSHAPLLWNNAPASTAASLEQHRNAWTNTLLTLATKTVSRVDPNVKQNGDLLDICPHVKIKTIAGGNAMGADCVYFSGVLFRKSVSHKIMRTRIDLPRILLLQGGIEFYQSMLSLISASASSGGASVVSGRQSMASRSSLQRTGSSSSTVALSPSSSRANMGRLSAAGVVSSSQDVPVTLSSLDTLMEHEDKYLDRLVSQLLLVFRPDVILAGGSVCRRAQELLSRSRVTVISHVKPSLLQRIGRQTQAKILTADGIQTLMMNPDNDLENAALEEEMVGRCHRFRLATFRDNEIWVDTDDEFAARSDENESLIRPRQALRSIETLLADSDKFSHDRQAALVARQLGQGVLDGSEAVKAGLAKRGVAQTFVVFEGCPVHLGCTVVLRGLNKAAMKQVKTVFRFLVNVAYNLRLETSFLKGRGACIRPGFKVSEKHSFSSSICVDYGEPPVGKKVRPWNGSNAERIPRSATGEISAFDHQSILITSVWMTQQSQCCPAEVKGICYYSMQDVALGQFLRDSCFNLSLKCQNPNCKKSVLDHSLSFVHNDGLVNITVEQMEEELTLPSKGATPIGKSSDKKISKEADQPICTWSFCKSCKKVVAPLCLISEDTWKFSFGKFLETFFYNRDAIFNAPDYQCSCSVQSASRLYFGCGKLAAQFNYEPVRPFGVFVRRTLPVEPSFQKEEGIRRLETISNASSLLFVKFDKQIEKISRETRSLFNSPTVRPEHLQTVLSELNTLSSYVDDAAKTLQDKVASVLETLRRDEAGEKINAALFRFPWFARRYLFMLTYAWNEKLSAAGQAITTMKKASAAASRDGGIAPSVDPWHDELMESMKQLRKLNEHYTRYNMADITDVLPLLSENGPELQQDGDDEDDLFDKEEISAMDFADGVDADVVASRRRLQAKGIPDRPSSRPRPTKSLGTQRNESSRADGHDPSDVLPKATPGGAVKSALNRFFNRGGRDQNPYTVDLGVFAEGRPRLAPGVDGVVVPIFDEQLSTIIAYSLSSAEYAKQFKYYSRHEHSAEAGGSIQLESSTARQQSDSNGNASRTADQPSSSRQPKETSTGIADGAARRASAQKDTLSVEHRMLVRTKSHVKHTFRDFDEKGQATCKFVCTTYWATQFHAVRQVFLSQSRVTNPADSFDIDKEEFEQGYIESLSSSVRLLTSGGKSGASFHKTSDSRFIAKFISRTELQMFLDCAPAYFEYLSKAFFHGLPTVLCKILGVYQIGVHDRRTGKRAMEQVAVMQNIFYDRKITQVFDLKGSLRGRFAAHAHSKDDSQPDTPSASVSETNTRPSMTPTHVDDPGTSGGDKGNETPRDDDEKEAEKGLPTLLDGDFLEWTRGRPMPLTDRAKAVFQMSILNDTLFLSIINVLDYSILVGIDEENQELVVGIIDFMRQYDIMKQMERVGKSLPMVVGSEAPTIIQPPLYKARFSNAMERYFMGIPNKWTTI